MCDVDLSPRYWPGQITRGALYTISSGKCKVFSEFSARPLALRQGVQRVNHTAEFSQTTQPTSIGVARIDTRLAHFIAHQMTVVGTHGNGRPYTAIAPAAALLG